MNFPEELNPPRHAASDSAPADDQGLSGDRQVAAVNAVPVPTSAERGLVEAVPALYDLVARACDGPVLLLWRDGSWDGAAVGAHPLRHEPAGTGTPALASAPAAESLAFGTAAARAVLRGPSAAGAVLFPGRMHGPFEGLSDGGGVIAFIQAAGAGPHAHRWQVEPPSGRLVGPAPRVNLPAPVTDLLPDTGGPLLAGVLPRDPLTLLEIEDLLRGDGLHIAASGFSDVRDAVPGEPKWRSGGVVSRPDCRPKGLVFVEEGSDRRAIYVEVADDGAAKITLYDSRRALEDGRPEYREVLEAARRAADMDVPGDAGTREGVDAGAAPDHGRPAGWTLGVGLRLINLGRVDVAGPMRDLVILGHGDETAGRACVQAAVADALTKAGAASLRLAADYGIVAVVRGLETPLFTDRVYRECLLLPPAERAAFVREFASDVIELADAGPPETRAEAIPRLRPKVVSRCEWQRSSWEAEEDVAAPSTAGAYGPVHAAEHLAVQLAVDFPRGIMAVTHDQLQKWDLGYEEAYELALQNLRQAKGDDPLRTLVRTPTRLFVSSTRDHYDTAQLLLPEFLGRLPVGGDLVTAVPHPQEILVCGSDDHAALLEMAERVGALLEAPRAISGIPVVQRGQNGAWRPYLPPEGSPAHGPFADLRRRTLAMEYAAQVLPLNLMLDRHRDGAYVVRLLVGTPPGVAGPVSVATWGEGITSLLPEADVITFVAVCHSAQLKVFGSAPWNRVATVLGHLFAREDGIYPPRYRTAGFPSAAQRRRIGLVDGGGRHAS